MFLKSTAHALLRRFLSIQTEKIVDHNLLNEIPKRNSFKTPNVSNTKVRSRIYVWGGNQYGALGKETLLRNKRIKYQIKSPMYLYFPQDEKINRVACGYGYTLFASNTNVFGCGINVNSQIGFFEARKNSGQSLKYLIKPVKLKLTAPNLKSSIANPLTIKSISAGQNHSWILTQHGMFSLGCNRYGQCGRPINTNKEYGNKNNLYFIPFDDSSKNVFGHSGIKDIICGENATYFLGEHGNLFACGQNTYGQLGIGANSASTHEISKINFPFSHNVGQTCTEEHIIKVSCRANTVLVLTSQGRVFGWGNSEHGQFNAFTESSTVDKPIEIKFPNTNDTNPDNTGNKNCQIMIEDVACTNSMCAAVDKSSGSVWVWGMGPIGLGPLVNFSQKPQLLPPTLFHSSPVVRVVAGYDHFCALTQSGKFFVWGHNRASVLGLGSVARNAAKKPDRDDKTSPYTFPQPLPLLTGPGQQQSSKIKCLSAGFDHMAFVI